MREEIVSESPGRIGATDSRSIPAASRGHPKEIVRRTLSPAPKAATIASGATGPPYGPFFAASESVYSGLVSPTAMQYFAIISAVLINTRFLLASSTTRVLLFYDLSSPPLAPRFKR